MSMYMGTRKGQNKTIIIINRSSFAYVISWYPMSYSSTYLPLEQHIRDSIYNKGSVGWSCDHVKISSLQLITILANWCRYGRSRSMFEARLIGGYVLVQQCVVLILYIAPGQYLIDYLKIKWDGTEVIVTCHSIQSRKGGNYLSNLMHDQKTNPKRKKNRMSISET